MSAQDHPDLPAFVAACRAAGISSLALAWRREWGPRQVADDPSDYAPRDELRVLGYAAGTIYGCDLTGADRDATRSELEAAGFTVELRDRNMAFGDGRG